MKDQFRTMKSRMNSTALFKNSESSNSENAKQEALSVIYKRIEAFQFNEAIKLLTAFRNEYDNSTKYLYLNYHLVSLDQSNEAKLKRFVLAAQLLTNPDFIKVKVEVIERIWCDNPKLLTKLTPNHLKLIAYKLCESNNLNSSETIVDFLLSNGPKQSNIKLLQRLAKRFAELNNQEKRIKYLRIINSSVVTGE